MQVVLYTDDMEAITVIDLPMSFLERLREGRRMRVAVMLPLDMTTPIHSQNIPLDVNLITVDIWAEKFVRKDKLTWFLFTNDEEAALMLKSDVLPGQRKDYQDQFKRGFMHGLLAAVGL